MEAGEVRGVLISVCKIEMCVMGNRYNEAGNQKGWSLIILSPIGLSFLLGGPEVRLLASPTPNELNNEPDLPREAVPADADGFWRSLFML